MHKERETYACTHTHKEKERWGREKERERKLTKFSAAARCIHKLSKTFALENPPDRLR